MHLDIINSKQADFEKSVNHFKEELNQLRTGRASAALVENIPVDYYGARSPLKQVASITVPEPKIIVISPWDKSQLAGIEKGIRESQLNLNPVNDGQIIRVVIPALTEERRKELVKILNKKSEEARIAVRQCREEIWEEIQEAEKESLISEDDKFSGKNKLQNIVDEYNRKIEEIRGKKEEEILKV